MPKNLSAGTFRRFKAVLPGQKQLLTSVHNEADDADATDDADNYNRVIGIVLLKAFSCAKKWL